MAKGKIKNYSQGKDKKNNNDYYNITISIGYY